MGFDPSVVDMQKARKYLESGEVHPSDICDIHPSGYLVSLFQALAEIKDSDCTEDGPLFSINNSEDMTKFTQQIESQRDVCRLLYSYHPTHESKLIIYHHIWPRCGSEYYRMKVSEVHLKSSPRVFLLNNEVARNWYNSCHIRTTQLAFLFTSIVWLNGQSDAKIVPNALNIMKVEYINHIEPEDISTLTIGERCLLRLICRFIDGVESALITQLSDYGSATFLTEDINDDCFLSIQENSAFFHRADQYLDQNQTHTGLIESLVDVVAERGTTEMLKFVLDIGIGNLQHMSQTSATSYTLPSWGRHFPKTNLELLFERGAQFSDSWSAASFLSRRYGCEPSFRACTDISNHCRFQGNEFVFALFILRRYIFYDNPYGNPYEGLSKLSFNFQDKLLLDRFIDAGLSTTHLKLELLICILMAPRYSSNEETLNFTEALLEFLSKRSRIDEEITSDCACVPEFVQWARESVNSRLRTFNRFTPLMLAVYDGRLSMTKYMIASGARVSKKTSSGESALSLIQAYLRGLYPREVSGQWKHGKICWEQMRAMQSYEEDLKIYCLMKNAAVVQDGSDFPRQICHCKPAKIFHMFKRIRIMARHNLDEWIWRYRVQRLKEFISSKIFVSMSNKHTFFELLAFRSFALATLLISGFLQLNSQFSGSHSMGFSSPSHKWLLLGVVALIAVREFGYFK